MKFLHTKKFRHGSISLALTIVVIVAVILLNTLVTALAEKFLWYIDMTPNPDYELTDEARALLDTRFTEDFDREVKIIFCTPYDELWENSAQRYPMYTAKQMEEEYDNIHVEYVDIYTNPSAVAKYKDKTSQTITATSVIVVGYDPTAPDPAQTEQVRVYALSALYQYDSSGSSIVGYHGEQRLISAALAVTQVKQPVVCFPTNHQELDSMGTNNAIVTLLYEAGFDVKEIDLSAEEIPADCTMMVIFAPAVDYADSTSLSGVSEIDKIKTFLKNDNSLMVFFDYDTPELPNLEDFLEQWGIVIARSEVNEVTSGWLIKDDKHALPNSRYINKGVYVVEEDNVGSSMTEGLRRSARPKSVIFPMVGAIRRPDQYQLITGTAHQYYYTSNGQSRTSYDVFMSGDSARAVVGGSESNGIAAPFSYMTITEEVHADNLGNTTTSRVLACATTQFASSAALNTEYGNHSLLSYAASILGQTETVVSLDCKYFADLEINNITKAQANQYTVVLTVVPASLIFIAGIFVMVRRKYR